MSTEEHKVRFYVFRDLHTDLTKYAEIKEDESKAEVLLLFSC